MISLAERASRSAAGEPGRPKIKDQGLPNTAVLSAISEFGIAVAAKFAAGDGSKEDHLRGPFDKLIRTVGKAFGLNVVAVGETRLPDLGIRPDYGVDVAGARVGYVELKAPGLGVPGTRAPNSRRDREQWRGLALLPNVLYTDGQEWALYRSGDLVGEPVRLSPNVRRAGRRLRAEDSRFERLLHDFLTWNPARPRTIGQLVRVTAGLCRLLRDEVAEIISQERAGILRPAHFTRLAHEWRELLFPQLTDTEFADAYAQTVTFALLLARVEGIEFTNRSAGEIALLLGKRHSLMGKALGVLVNDTVERDSIVVDTLLRVVGVVYWEDFDHEAYLNLFQHFLQEYDPDLRKRSGSYYTPDEVVSFMVGFVDEVLRRHLGRSRGFADDDVIVVDPAMGTGGFLARVVDRVADTINDLEGPGQVAPRLRALSRRLIGFEKQAAPYAVAELRLQNLLRFGYGAEVPNEEYRFLTDALDNPDIQELGFGSVYDQISRSRTGANRVKRSVPVMVVIGNPPYRERAKGAAPWIEARGADFVARPSLDAFRAPGKGKYEHRMSNLYVYFWRWGTWKVFDAHPEDPTGIVAFITTSAYLAGPGFGGMREYLRRAADEGWIIDLSPEGYRPPTNTRVFPETRHRVCIGLFVRRRMADRDTPAAIRYMSVEGTRQQKFSRLANVGLDDVEWDDCPTGWRDAFVPSQDEDWLSSPALAHVMPWSTTGVNPNRTWVYAPTPEVLKRRWARLIGAPASQRPLLVKETHARTLDAHVAPLPGYPPYARTIREEDGSCPEPVRVAFRSFDRQWLIPDARLHHRPTRDLWRVLSEKQVYVTEQRAHPIQSGPGLTFSGFVPDMDHFDGRGGRTIPLYRDRNGTVPNFDRRFIDHLEQRLGVSITPEDMLAYIAGVAAHRGYVCRFSGQLAATPGIRIPITADPSFWLATVEVGREVVWLHTYGQRFYDSKNGRPRHSPLLEPQRRPKVLSEIPDQPSGMPNSILYDAASHALCIGAGRIAPVEHEVWDYRIGSRRVVERWFGYRRRKPAYRWSSPLNDILQDVWFPELTTELLELINVLGRCIGLEKRQEQCLAKVLGGPRVTETELRNEGLLPPPDALGRPVIGDDDDTQLGNLQLPLYL